MKHSLRWVLLIILLMLLSLGGGLLWIVQQEAKVEAAVLESIASRLLTDAHIGNIALDIKTDFPQISLRLEDVVVMGSSSNKADTLLKASRIQLHCNAFQLLLGQYQIESASIENGFISLVSAASGSWNTAVWKAADKEKTDETRFNINGLNLKSCVIQINESSIQIPEMQIDGTWEDATLRANIEGELEKIRLEKNGELLPSATLKMETFWDESTGDVSIQMHRALWLEGNWQTEANYNPEEGWTCKGEFKGIPFREILPWLALPKPFDSLASNVEVSGKFDWENDELGLQTTLPNAKWSASVEGLSERIAGQFKASIWAKFSNERWRIDVPQWTFEMDGVQLNGNLNAFNPQSGFFDSSALEAAVNTEQLGAWRTLFAEEDLWPSEGWGYWNGNIDRDARTALSAEGTWELRNCIGTREGALWSFDGSGTLNPEEFTVQQSRILWGDDSLTGTAKFNDPMAWIPGKSIRGQVDLQLESWSYQNTGAAPLELTQLALPPNSQIDWSLSCSRAHSIGWTLTNIEAQGTVEPLIWTLQRFRSETLEGQLSGDGQILFIPQEDRAVIQWHPVATELNLPSLFQAFDNFKQSTLRAEHLQGLLTASGTLQFDCSHVLAWTADTFEMLGEARIEGGALRNLEAFERIADYLKENRMMAPLVDPDDLAQRLQSIAFEPLESPIYVAKQSVYLPEVQIRSSAMNISLGGSYSFDGKLDYTLGFAMRDLRNNREDQFGPVEDDGLGQQFFIEMTGNVNSPEYGWDREAQRNHRKSNFQREKELLKSLFKRS